MLISDNFEKYKKATKNLALLLTMGLVAISTVSAYQCLDEVANTNREAKAFMKRVKDQPNWAGAMSVGDEVLSLRIRLKFERGSSGTYTISSYKDTSSSVDPFDIDSLCGEFTTMSLENPFKKDEEGSFAVVATNQNVYLIQKPNNRNILERRFAFGSLQNLSTGTLGGILKDLGMDEEWSTAKVNARLFLSPKPKELTGSAPRRSSTGARKRGNKRRMNINPALIPQLSIPLPPSNDNFEDLIMG